MIGAVSAATGVSVGHLRAWEVCYDPERSPRGLRRDGPHDIEAIRPIQRDRTGGMELAAAIARAGAGQGVPAASLYAGLRRHRPDQPVANVTKPALAALS